MEGYAKLARLMGRHSEYAVFRRFGSLNAQNLLYLQAELAHLERKLEGLANRDAQHIDRAYFSRDWWSLSHSDNDEDIEQWQAVLEIRTKLDMYNTALIKQAEIARLARPSPYDLEFLRRWLVRPGMGNFPLLGFDRYSYSEQHEQDLVAVKGRPAPDFFSRWFTYTLVPTWNAVLGESLKKPVDVHDDLGEGLYLYEDNFLVAVLRIITTVVASLLPVCSVIILYFVQNNTTRLGLMVAASGVFALALALMTNARKIEVFAATSAFAAVNVVFLTNTIPLA